MENESRLIDVNRVIRSMQIVLEENQDKKNSISYKAFETFIDALQTEPTVDAVEVIHAHWEMGVDEGDYEYGTCSVCGYNEYNAFGCLLPHNYCPNCGAKMDGGNEDG